MCTFLGKTFCHFHFAFLVYGGQYLIKKIPPYLQFMPCMSRPDLTRFEKDLISQEANRAIKVASKMTEKIPIHLIFKKWPKTIHDRLECNLFQCNLCS